MRLLLVEDSDRLQELLGETLRQAGYGLDVVGTVAGMLESAATVPYDLLIVDLGLPDGDGLDAINALRTQGFVPRPARPDIVSGAIHGKEQWQFDFTEEQYRALARLCAALHRVFPRIQLDAPRGADGAVLMTNLPEEQLMQFDGIVGHYHVQKNKTDPGPAFQWERVLREARELSQ
jgi:CheY-like chemotaxis protein